MKCKSGRCYSPVACEGFGYCRDLNQAKSFHDGKVILHAGDCMEVLRIMPADSIDAVVTDPPYHLTSIVKRFGGANAAPAKGNDAFVRASRGFMNKVWDGGDIAFQPELWAEVLRVLKPGGHMVCFGGTRTYHRMVCAIEDAGFEIRDAIMWHYGSGFPKSHDVSKGIDRAAGVERDKVARTRVDGKSTGHAGATFNACDVSEVSGPPITNAARQWQGYGTALKPATEIICLARKPLSESTVAANVLRWGTGALNIDGCRIGLNGEKPFAYPNGAGGSDPNHMWRGRSKGDGAVSQEGNSLGRWPANLCHDGSPEVTAGFPETANGYRANESKQTGAIFGNADSIQGERGHNDSGSAARFFASFPQDETAKRFHYTSKADADDRLNSKHPTVKPVDLMQWLVRLVCPKGATVMDPFAGTGTTGAATFIEGCKAVLIEREAEYLMDIERRMGMLLSGADERARKLATPDPHDTLPLFAVTP